MDAGCRRDSTAAVERVVCQAGWEAHDQGLEGSVRDMSGVGEARAERPYRVSWKNGLSQDVLRNCWKECR